MAQVEQAVSGAVVEFVVDDSGGEHVDGTAFASAGAAAFVYECSGWHVTDLKRGGAARAYMTPLVA